MALRGNDTLGALWDSFVNTIATFFSRVMLAIGGNTAGPGDAVVNVYINHEKKFAFVDELVLNFLVDDRSSSAFQPRISRAFGCKGAERQIH